MSQEPLPESTDSESQALPVQGITLSDSDNIAESAAIANVDLSLSEKDVREAGIETAKQPTTLEEVSVEKVAELAASVIVSKPASRLASGDAVIKPQVTNWQKFQRYWQAEIRPALKEQTIKTLKGTIRSLDALVTRLEAKPVLSSDLPQAGTPPRRRGIWESVLGVTRSLLPGSFRRLPDWVLSGAIASVLLLTLWTTSSLIFSKSPTPVAIAPLTKSAPAKPTDRKEKVPPTEQPVVKPTPDILSTEPRPTQTLLTPPEKASDAIINAAKPAPSPTPTPLPKPIPPPLKLTPEQTLIARIQDQVAEVSNQYVNGLIQSVQANFRSSLLTIKVGDDWYTLEQAQQNKLANEMLNRAQQLNFVKLELTDSEGNLLARSPVVGSAMVILKRATSLQQTR